jgi:hypothetical protein
VVHLIRSVAGASACRAVQREERVRCRTCTACESPAAMRSLTQHALANTISAETARRRRWHSPAARPQEIPRCDMEAASTAEHERVSQVHLCHSAKTASMPTGEKCVGHAPRDERRKRAKQRDSRLTIRAGFNRKPVMAGEGGCVTARGRKNGAQASVSLSA